jgi:hypothetical protein
MKKSVIALLAFIGISFTFMSMARNKMVSVKGHINYYGNAPFATAAFKTDDGKILAMEVAPDAKIPLKEVLDAQGHYLELTGEMEEAGLTDKPTGAQGKFIIYSYKKISVKGK